MKSYLKRIILIVISSILLTSNAIASDFYSHIVLNLPFDFVTNDPWIKIINSQEEWEVFYNELASGILASPSEADPAPEINFVEFQMVAGGLGYKSSGGTQVLITGVHEYEESVSISALEIRSGNNCLVTTGITYPTAAVLIKRTEKQITVSLDTVIKDCTE